MNSSNSPAFEPVSPALYVLTLALAGVAFVVMLLVPAWG